MTPYSDTQAVLSDLARAKIAFQARALVAAMEIPAAAIRDDGRTITVTPLRPVPFVEREG